MITPKKPQPKPRLSRPKRMTICIGMLASDGLVIAADAEESDRYYKRSQQKIFTFCGALPIGNNPNPPSMALALTGAGRAGYLDAFFDYAIKGISTGAQPQDFEKFLADKVYSFHERHIFPLAHATDPPEIDLLVGSHVGWQTRMFVSSGSTLRHAFPHAAVGAGAHFALSIINNLPARPNDIKRTELLAAYVIAVTKESIDGCGKYTAIVSLHNPVVIEGKDGAPSRMVPPPSLMTHVSSQKIHKWEESFGTTWAGRQNKLLSELVEEELAEENKL